MTTLWAKWRLYVVVGTVLTSVASVHLLLDQRHEAAAYAKGRKDVQDAAHFDSTLVALVDSTHAKAKAKTDTVIRTVTKIARRVDSIHVADTIRLRYPVVDTLVVESKALVVAVDSLTRTIAAERSSNALQLTLTRQQLQQSRLETGREHDRAVAAEQRPTWLRAAVYSTVSAAAAYGLGRLR